MGERANVNRSLNILEENLDWVLLLHSDDIAKPDWLTHITARICNCSGNVATICPSWDTLMPDGCIRPGEDNPQREVEIISGNAEAVRGTVRRGCWWHISGCAIRMRAFKDVGEFNPRLPQLGDWDWLLRCLHKGWAVEYVPRTLILYRQHELSVSAKSFQYDRDIRESLAILARYTGLLTKKDLIELHLRRMLYIVRRLLRAGVKLRLRRCLCAIGTMALVWSNLFKCCKGRTVATPTV